MIIYTFATVNSLYIHENNRRHPTAPMIDKIVPSNVTLREDSVAGEFQRFVHIFYRDFDNPTVLGISGTVIQYIFINHKKH